MANQRIPTDTNPVFHNMYIIAPLKGRDVVSWFSTHPPAEQRIAALRQQAASLR